MSKLASLLTIGNTKLGDGIATWSIPILDTCPGSTPTCRKECYADGFRFRQNASRYKANLQASREPGFVARMANEIRRRWIGCVRIHVTGDFYDAEYVGKWAAIAQACPLTRFYAYTRSWRVPGLARALGALSRLRNVRLWYSCDRDSGVPEKVPARVRLAWLQAAEEDTPPVGTGLVFRVARLRKRVAKRINLALVCPVENGATGHRTDCGRCRFCVV